MFACSVQIISCLDIQSKFEMFTPFACCDVGVNCRYCTPTWRLHTHTGLCKFVQNILANIWSLWKGTACRSKTCKCVFFIYQINLLLCDSANKEYQLLRPLCLLFLANLINYKKNRPFFAVAMSSIYCNRPIRKIISNIIFATFHEIIIFWWHFSADWRKELHFCSV